MPSRSLLHIGAVVATSALVGSAALAQSEDHHYGLRYDLTLLPAEDRAEVSLSVDERIKGNIWSWRFRIDPQYHAGFEGDGNIVPDGQYVTWTPPETGGRLSFHLPVSHRRANGAFDARMTDDWALFRGDELFPPARTDQRDDAEADATLHVHLPEGWSFVTAYPEMEANVFEIEHAHRSFDRPTGWMIAGHLGVRRERIAGVRVAVAGPMNQGVRRMDMIALLNWNLPVVRRLIPDMPDQLLVVSAGDPMWRGGLSGPNSLYLHAKRPLLSENGTSALLHEVMHVATGLKAERGGDWIVEGMAEYYSLKLMWRSGTITDQRYKKAFRKLEDWAEEAGPLDVDRSSAAITARAVGVLRELDHEIYKETEHESSLDEVVRLLAASPEKVNVQRLRQAAVAVMGKPANALTDEALGIDTTDR